LCCFLFTLSLSLYINHPQPCFKSQGGLIMRLFSSSLFSLLSLLYFLNLFNWRIIALRCCIDFCCTTIGISYKYTFLFLSSTCESLQFALSFTVVDIRETWICSSGLNHVFMCSYFTSGTKICIKEAEAVGAL